MRCFAKILSPSFHGLHKERLAQWPAFCVPKNRSKIPGGVLPEKLGRGVRHAFWNPYPISDQNLWFSLPYLRPDQKFDTLFQTWSPGARRVTSCYDTDIVVGVNIKREIVLSLNDEEVANSSTKRTQFKTRVHKPYPISDQNGRNWYPGLFQTKTAKKKHTLGRGTYLYSLYKGLPQGAKNTLQIISLAAYASETNKAKGYWISRCAKLSRNINSSKKWLS